MAFAMYESWRRAHILREQLSSDTVESGVTHGYTPNQTQIPAPNILPHVILKLLQLAIWPQLASKISAFVYFIFQSTQESKSGELSLSSLLTWGGNEYVELRPEHSGGVGGASNHPGAGASGATVYSEASQSGTHVKEMQLEAKIACTKDDVLQRSWQIKFINCQMLLKGTETKGYIIVGAAKAEATKKLHVPVWKEETLLSKSSWSGSLERMQYFATVSGEEEDKMTTIEWLSKESIQSDHGEEFLDDVGAVGGVVGKGALQRIVSKCTCEFYYVAYGEEPLEEVMDKMPASISAENKSIWSDHDSLVDAFALIHHDLNICTNSLQYSMVLDILNNLLLFVDPTLKSRTENHLRMKYQLMLSNIEDQRKPITQLKIQIR